MRGHLSSRGPQITPVAWIAALSLCSKAITFLSYPPVISFIFVFWPSSVAFISTITQGGTDLRPAANEED